MKVQSKITSKFQVTIPKEIRERLHLEENQLLEWQVSDSGISVSNSQKPFLQHGGIIQSPSRDIKLDIQNSWKNRAKKFS